MSRHGDEFFAGNVNVPNSSSYEGPYGRLFRHLPAFEPPVAAEPLPPEDVAWASEGRKRRWFRRLARRLSSPGLTENPRIPAGYTYLGQFLTHDISFDATTLSQRQEDPQRLRNFRTPRLDLDSVYGAGPRLQPFLYDQYAPGDDRAAKRKAWGAENAGFVLLSQVPVGLDPEKRPKDWMRARCDLPRNHQGRALIPDPRNDSHLILTQLHVAFVRFHNHAMLHLRERGLLGEEAFHEARKLTCWHYQWVVAHDFLPRLVGSRTAVERLLAEPEGGYGGQGRVYDPEVRPFIPLEFSAAVFRFGHAMIRPTYALNERVLALPVFERGAERKRKLADLRGGRPLPREALICWNRFVEYRGSRPQPSQRIRRKVSASLDFLPGTRDGEPFLAARDLIRSWRLGLPSGQDVARALGVPPHDGYDPLWYYVLKEAQLDPWAGMRLGPVARHIVSEVLVGLLAGDRGSFLRQEPRWTPSLGGAGRDFGLAHFLEFAGMPMD